MTIEIQELKEQIVVAGLASIADFVGCSPKEIRKVEAEAQISLPRFYVRFLESMGKGAGYFLRGSSVFYPELLQLRRYAEELLREMGFPFQLGERDFVFFVHQGYQFAYFQVDAGDDPRVWCFEEEWEAPEDKWGTLSEFFLAVVRDQSSEQ